MPASHRCVWFEYGIFGERQMCSEAASFMKQDLIKIKNISIHILRYENDKS